MIASSDGVGLAAGVALVSCVCASTNGTTAKTKINARTFICRIDILLRERDASMPLQEAMHFIANALEQAQSTRIERQLQGQRPAGAINLFVFLRQSDNRKVMQSQSLQLAACRGELAFSTIDNDEIGQPNVRLRIADCGLR